MNAIPYLDLTPQYRALEQPINERIQRVLAHGQFILGPEVDECEEALAAYIGCRYALTAASGTDALIMALLALEIGPGDEVITTPFTFFATAEVISLLGATPVFVDVDPDTYNLDPTRIEAAITPKTRAILPVSLYGQPADFDEINAIASALKLSVIEDAAQSFGARYKDARSCNLAEVSATSFFPAKPLGCYGDGGAVFTNDAALMARMKQLRVHGQESRYRHVAIGINGRLDTLQCAILIEKLKRYDWEVDQRQKIADRYAQAFGPLGDRIRVPVVRPDRSSVWAQYTVLVADRDQFAQDLKSRGVPTSVHYPQPLHWQPVYASIREKYRLPVAEKLSSQCISLPIYPDMAIDIQERIIDAVQSALS